MKQYGKSTAMVEWTLAQEGRKILVPNEQRRSQLLKQFPNLPGDRVIVPPEPKLAEWINDLDYFDDDRTPGL